MDANEVWQCELYKVVPEYTSWVFEYLDIRDDCCAVILYYGPRRSRLNRIQGLGWVKSREAPVRFLWNETMVRVWIHRCSVIIIMIQEDTHATPRIPKGNMGWTSPRRIAHKRAKCSKYRCELHDQGTMRHIHRLSLCHSPMGRGECAWGC
jgi:hypothetical protein